MSEDKIDRAHCNECGQDTRHFVVAVRIQRGSTPHTERFSVDWINTYSLLECCGCEAISVKRSFWWSEEPEDEHVEYFPPRVSRRLPSWIDKLPEETAELMREIYGALQADHRRLALMGARTVIDGLLTRNVGGDGTFVARLNALEKQGFLSKRNRKVLEAMLNAGHAAVHRSYRPNPKNLGRVMDIVENVLQAEYLGKVVDNLERTTPSREHRKK